MYFMAPSSPRGQLTLPVLVFGMIEVRRLQRELEALDEFFNQARLRAQAGQESPKTPKTSRLLDALAQENHINLQHVAERQILINFLNEVATSAPNIHISFAADPSSAFTAKIVTWLRASIHPYALLQLGLQPSIAAGCEVRTPNQLFDFSLRHHFENQRNVLIQAIRGKAGA
jgi:F0F1-type ATP synthase delta subunit